MKQRSKHAHYPKSLKLWAIVAGCYDQYVIWSLFWGFISVCNTVLLDLRKGNRSCCVLYIKYQLKFDLIRANLTDFIAVFWSSNTFTRCYVWFKDLYSGILIIMQRTILMIPHINVLSVKHKMEFILTVHYSGHVKWSVDTWPLKPQTQTLKQQVYYLSFRGFVCSMQICVLTSQIHTKYGCTSKCMWKVDRLNTWMMNKTNRSYRSWHNFEAMFWFIGL